MATLKLKAKLTGVGAVNNAYIYLENVPTEQNPNAVAIGLFPKDNSRKEWNNNKISIEVDRDLEYQLNVHAVKGTDWTFSLTNADTSKEILNATGTTGEHPSDGLNISVKKGAVVFAGMAI